MSGHRYQPSTHDVEALIEGAKRHSLGTDFLIHGAQDAVAATFQVHAFVVDAARARLSAEETPIAEPSASA